ncbi:MAG TPA: hypothetical protein VIJ88_01040 [Candidatus Paceibacterota bacterium]
MTWILTRGGLGGKRPSFDEAKRLNKLSKSDDAQTLLHNELGFAATRALKTGPSRDEKTVLDIIVNSLHSAISTSRAAHGKEATTEALKRIGLEKYDVA